MRAVVVVLCLAALALAGTARAEMTLPERTIQPPPPPGMPPQSGTYRDPLATPPFDLTVGKQRLPTTPKKKRKLRRR